MKSEAVPTKESELDQAFFQHVQSIDKRSDEPAMSCKEQIMISKTSIISESVAHLEDNMSQHNSDAEQAVSDKEAERLSESKQEELTYEEPTNNEASASSKKRRNRSPDHEMMLAPSKMTLRNKVRPNYAQMGQYAKPVKAEPVVEEDEDDIEEEKLTFGLPGEQIPGASYLKYEVLEKKG